MIVYCTNGHANVNPGEAKCLVCSASLTERGEEPDPFRQMLTGEDLQLLWDMKIKI